MGHKKVQYATKQAEMPIKIRIVRKALGDERWKKINQAQRKAANLKD